MSTVDAAQIEAVQKYHDFWKQFEQGNWVLHGFTDKHSATFMNRVNKTQILLYAHVVRFLRGVDPDVLDQL